MGTAAIVPRLVARGRSLPNGAFLALDDVDSSGPILISVVDIIGARVGRVAISFVAEVVAARALLDSR